MSASVVTNLDVAALVEGLERADLQADPRDCVGEALLAVHDFLQGIPQVRRRDLDAPIFALILALADLRKSTTAPMLKGGRSPNGPQAPTARRLMKGYCSFMVDRLLANKLSLEEACKVVAGALEGSSILKGHHTQTWQKIKNWRDGAAKLDADNQERAILDALRAQALEADATPDHVVALIRQLDAKMGRFG